MSQAKSSALVAQWADPQSSRRRGVARRREREALQDRFDFLLTRRPHDDPEVLALRDRIADLGDP